MEELKRISYRRKQAADSAAESAGEEFRQQQQYSAQYLKNDENDSGSHDAEAHDRRVHKHPTDGKDEYPCGNGLKIEDLMTWETEERID